MTTKWEYMYLEYDGTPNPDLSPVERMKEAMLGKKEAKLYLPDGSLKIVPMEGVGVMHRYHILGLLNQLGQSRWEAFEHQSDTLREFWVLKREFVD